MKDERKFKEVMHTIKGAEKDKDKFCKAARIERQPMSQEKLEALLGYIALYLGMILVLHCSSHSFICASRRCFVSHRCGNTHIKWVRQGGRLW